MTQKITDANASDQKVTTTVEGADTGVEGASQENNASDGIAAKLTQYEDNLKKLSEQISSLEKEKNDAKADSLKWQATYRGLQAQTTEKLKERADLVRQLAESQTTRNELLEVKELLNQMASRVLDESERKELEFKQRENRLQLAEQVAQQRSLQAVQAQDQPTQQVSQGNDKEIFLRTYFPGVEVDPNDPNIDWGYGAQSREEAFSRVIASVLKVKEQKDQSKAQNVVEEIQRQAQATLAEIRAQQEELTKTAEEELETAKQQAKEEARKEQEKKLRAMGIDAGTTPAPDGARRTIAKRLTEELDERLLTQGEPGSQKRKAGELEYQRRLEALKKSMRGQ